ncbi:MAG: radical SAM protein, partial [Nitrospiraceae bacterium]
MAEKMTKIGEGNSRLAVITPSLLCNYNCPYCRIKKKERGDYEYTLREWFDALVRAGAPVAHVAGGEPTVLRGFEEFVVKYPSPVRMTTNLWKHPSMWSPEFWRKFEYITLSFHPSHTSFEKFSEKVAYLADFFQKAGEGPEMACTIVAYPEYLDSIKDWIARLTELGVKARGQYYNSPANDATKTYTRDELERLKDLSIPMSAQVAGQEVYAERTLKECNAGMYYTHIDMRGNARRCSRDRMSLGNIFDGSFKWFGEHQQCQTACTEACDMAFARYKILEVVNREERNSREEACMGAQSAKDKCNGRNGGDSDTRPPLHNLEYQKKALERFAMFCSHKGKDILEIGSDPDLRVIQYLGERARSVFG